jgi:heme-degrading monooxygenase HmoA
VIERHITFTVEPGNGDDFERFFSEQYQPAATLSPGSVRVELLRAAEDPAHYEMTFQWVDAGAATGWRVSPIHEALQPELKRLASMGEIRIYEVVTAPA